MSQKLPEPEKATQQASRRETQPASTHSFRAGAHPILQLQRTLGNRHVAQLIKARRLTPEGRIIGSRIIPLQPKLTVGAADDQYEQEADRVARRVVSMPDSAVLTSSPQASAVEGDAGQHHTLQGKPLPLAASITPFVQRQIGAEEEREESQDNEEDNEGLLHAKFLIESAALPLRRQPVAAVEKGEEAEEAEPIQAKSGGLLSDSFDAGDDVESRLNQSKGGGSQLPDSVRAYMEPRFGVDFSHVRVHTGSDAIQMNRDVGAQAFTHGSDIYYGAGSSPGNLELTAHELTHVVQQGGLKQVQPLLQRFPVDLDTATRANINLVYKVFDERGNLLATERFVNRNQGLNITLASSRNYFIQVIGNVLITQTGPNGVLRAQYDYQADWPRVHVDELGSISIEPTTFDLIPQTHDQNLAWVLNSTLPDPYTLENRGRLRIEFMFSDSTVRTETRGTSQGTSTGTEFSVEPAGLGVASTSESSFETTHGQEISRGRPISNSFGLFLNLTVPGQGPRGNVSQGPIAIQRGHNIFFRSGDDTVSSFQLEGLYIWYSDLNQTTRELIESGQTHVRVIGYASTTDNALDNQILSYRRAEAVSTILSTYVGNRAIIDIRGVGESQTETADNVESSFDQRATILVFETEEP